MTPRKLGRLPRRHDPLVPHFSRLAAGRTLPELPPAVDHTTGMPAELGPMLNDRLSDCTCAAFYHAVQVWSFNTSADHTMHTVPDSDVLALYASACGYRPDVPGSDPGGDVQTVLTHLLRVGAPVAPAGKPSHRIAAFIELDPTKPEHLKRAIADCGVVYLGFRVPHHIVPDNAPTPEIWDVQDSDPPDAGSHCVLLAGYGSASVRVISWGRCYTMTLDFLVKYADEAYALVDRNWLTRKQTSLAGLSLAQIEAEMAALGTAPLQIEDKKQMPVGVRQESREPAVA